MGTGLINTGVTGIQVAQMGLQTTSHNISNANTAGFNRQRIVQANNIAMSSGAGFIGQGAHVSTVERMYSVFLNNQVNGAQTNVSELDTYYAQVNQIDTMLADTNSGLSPALQDFFTGVQQVAANPSQLPSRQGMISSAQALVARYQGLDDQLNQMYESVNGRISATVSSINSYTSGIGVLNQQIIIAESSNNQPANDLRDQRDQLISELNKLVKVSTTTNTNGSLNVFIGTGQQLVVGSVVSKMTALPSSADPTRFAVGLQTAGGSQELPESLINGGSLGGLLSFRSGSLDRVANDLGRNAASLALTFNAQYALGQDLLGQSTGVGTFQDDFFKILKPTVTASTNNKDLAAGPTVTASFSPPSFSGNFYTDLTNSDYRLTGTATGVSLTRLSDNKQWTGADVTAINTALAIEPQGFSLATTGVLLAGSSYLIKPTRDLASNISVNGSIAADVRLIAAAAPVRTQVVTGNTGGATISAGTVAKGYQTAIAGAPIKLVYNSNTTPASTPPIANLSGFPAGLAVSVTVPGVVPPTTDYPAPVTFVPYVSGATITLVGTNPQTGFSFEIQGSPNNGDAFSIEKNASGVSDSRNALVLGQLQTQNTMSGKTATYQSAYAQLVSDLGNKTREVKVTGAAQQSLLDQSSSAQQSLSGVNLDEEAANLIQYQQAYQASAKIIDIGSKLFDTILALGA